MIQATIVVAWIAFSPLWRHPW